MALDTEVSLGPGHIVLDGFPAPLPRKGGGAPNFRPMSIVAKRQLMALGVEVGLGTGHIMLDGDPDPLLTKGAAPPPQFSAHFYCGQPSVCIKMPLGMKVGFNPGDFVLDGEQNRRGNRVGQRSISSAPDLTHRVIDPNRPDPTRRM